MLSIRRKTNNIKYVGQALINVKKILLSNDPQAIELLQRLLKINNS